jgi:hypothetical protein
MTTYTGHWMAVDAQGNNHDGGELRVAVDPSAVKESFAMAHAMIEAMLDIRKTLGGADPIGLSVTLTREDG